MSNVLPKPDGTASQLVTLMQNQFTVPDGYSLKVLKWYDPDIMLKDTLEKEEACLLISVKRKNSTFKREYNRVVNTETIPFEIQIWAIETPEYLEPIKAKIVDNLRQQVIGWFQKNNLFGTAKATDNLDHTKHQQQRLTTLILVTQLNEELTQQQP